ncbi:MAG: DUF2058 domain-containing protein [Gammaproteobacteria bacterium]|nr:DUF2058 domain-containing protein [Gammaproteobacteria bacterium]
MSNALQEQLLKAGLTTEKKIKKEIHAKNKVAKQNKKKKNKRVEVDENKLIAQKATEEKRQRDRELNKQKEDAAKQKAIISQIKQLIETSKINTDTGDVSYNFEDNKVVKKIHVTETMHDQISRGKLAIVKFSEKREDKYEIVPSNVAKKIQDRDPKYIIVLNDNKANDDIDEEYADYQIPDDLMW